MVIISHIGGVGQHTNDTKHDKASKDASSTNRTAQGRRRCTSKQAGAKRHNVVAFNTYGKVVRTRTDVISTHVGGLICGFFHLLAVVVGRAGARVTAGAEGGTGGAADIFGGAPAPAPPPAPDDTDELTSDMVPTEQGSSKSNEGAEPRAPSWRESKFQKNGSENGNCLFSGAGSRTPGAACELVLVDP